jgi:uncharacterized protein YwgA
MFLLSRESTLPADEAYEFAGYDYGPFSVEIYRDLDELLGRRQIERLEAPGYTWSRYRPTNLGIAEARVFLDDMDSDERKCAVYLQELKRGALSMSFRQLLQHVYSHYPEFRKNSVFDG